MLRIRAIESLDLPELAPYRTMKQQVEHYRERLFVAEGGALAAKAVPGSFHEFITRHEKQAGILDLSFDSSNAQAIFKMTSVEC